MSIKCPHCDEYVNGKIADCKVCAKSYITIRNAEYCSNACKQKFYRELKKFRADSTWSKQESYIIEQRQINHDLSRMINRIEKFPNE